MCHAFRYTKESRFAFSGIIFCLLILFCGLSRAEDKFSPPASPRITYNFNAAWKFIKQDAPGAEKPDFDDSKWDTVSTPHTYNDVDSFDEIIGRGGEKTLYMGPACYRKHFKLPTDARDRKVFIEFEGMRQAARFFINGKAMGIYENGVTPCGIDITDAVYFGDKENVLTVLITNVTNYQEESSGTVFQWESKDFNPNYGGLNRNVWLHITGKTYQTFPLYENLKTAGTYIYAADFNIPAKTVTINVESQVRNESGGQQAVDLSAVVVDAAGITRAVLKGETYDMVENETAVLKASGQLAGARWWDPADPYLYDVYIILTVDGNTVDVNKIRTGFRKTAFRGGAGKGGVYINDRLVYLKGYAQRSIDEWAAVGGAYPDWMHDYTADLIRSGNGNYMRWMHIAPKAQNVRACDRFGIVEICPAGDKEKDATGRQWEQRVEVMRDTIIYYRNHPSILIWEAGNNGVSPAHMQQMVDLRKELDPNGGRVMGCRTLNDPGTTNIAELFEVMIGQDPKTDALKKPSDQFRAFSQERRDLAPFIETEDFRDEAARRFWDDNSPPHFGFKPGPNDTYKWNSETFCLAAAGRYNDYYSQIITNSDPNRSKWSGYASIIFADSNQHGRQASSEVCRNSGKVDAVRLPKQIYFLHRVMQNEKPDIHVIGHWTYPADTKKTVYVAGNHLDAVELFANGVSKGKSSEPTNGYIYAFKDIPFEPGTIKAVGIKMPSINSPLPLEEGQGVRATAAKDGVIVCEHELTTAGPPKALKLTAHTGPKGLLADGSDVAFIDFEVTDAQGRRCPTDEGRVDFEITGPAIWRGGYNSGIPGSTNNKYLNTECGINRVFIRSTLTPGTINLKATREGLQPAEIRIESSPVKIVDGLSLNLPQVLHAPAE
jgi:beta-galactosidase